MKRKILVLGIAFLGYYTIGFAQERTIHQPTRQMTEMRAQKWTPEQIADKRTQRLDKAVGLNADQKERIHAIYLQQAKESKERVSVRKDDQKEIKSILSPEQNQKLKEMKQERMEKMSDRQNRMQGTNTGSMRENK